MASLPSLAVVNYVAGEDRDALLRLLAADGYRTLELDGESVHDRSSFLRATGGLLGGDAAEGWEELRDRLRERVALHSRSCLVWTDADRMLDHGLADLVAALDALAGISRTLYARDLVFLTFLLGAGANFPRLADSSAP